MAPESPVALAAAVIFFYFFNSSSYSKLRKYLSVFAVKSQQIVQTGHRKVSKYLQHLERSLTL